MEMMEVAENRILFIPFMVSRLAVFSAQSSPNELNNPPKTPLLLGRVRVEYCVENAMLGEAKRVAQNGRIARGIWGTVDVDQILRWFSNRKAAFTTTKAHRKPENAYRRK